MFKIFKSKREPQLYKKCNELPIHNFNEAANGDYSFLKKNSGDVVSDEDLQVAWLDILDEYLTVSNNTYAVTLLKKKAKAILLEKKLYVLQTMKFCADRNIDIDEYLKEYNIKKEKLAVNIGMIKNDLNRLVNTMPESAEKQSNSTDFDRSIAVLNKNGFNINRFTTVVSEWVQALNILEQQHKQNHND